MTPKYSHRSRTSQGIEVLESRIAPASVFFSFLDDDGDQVKVTSSKGTTAQLAAAITLASGATGHATLIDLTAKVGAVSVFAGANISVVATANGGDGLVRVEMINATGVDLGTVSVTGELDSIYAGDANSGTPALKSITVQQWGNGNAYDSEVVGAITTLTVNGDFNGAYLYVRGSDSNVPDPAPPAPPAPHLTDPQGKIGTLFIGGSLIGTARDPLQGETVGMNGGHIFTTGDITKATIAGSIVGFHDANSLVAAQPQKFSGRIFSLGTIGSLTVGTDAVDGGIVGGDGASTGQVVGVTGIGSVIVKGSVQGGDGLESGSIGAVGTIGSVTITKGLIGGGGDRSGTVLAYTTINSVTISAPPKGAAIQGGGGENSGAVGAGSEFSSIPGLVSIGTVVINGDVAGGDGVSSGQIVSQGTIKNITINGSLVGGSEYESGAIGSLKGLGPIKITGNIMAGTGDRSGFIATEEEPKSEGDDPGAANAPIASVTVLGSIIGYQEDSESSSGYRAGGILASGALGPVIIKGDVIGGDTYETGRIASSHGITSVTIGGQLAGGGGYASGSIFAGANLGPVSIGDPSFTLVTPRFHAGLSPNAAISTRSQGIVGGDGPVSGSVIARTLTKIDVFGDLQGGGDSESGVIETLHGMGPVYIAGNLIGGTGDHSGEVLAGGKLAKITIGGYLLGGNGPSSGRIETIGSGALGNMGAVFIGGSLIATGSSAATNSAQIVSSGKIAGITIGDPKDSNFNDGGSFTGGSATGSGQIVSQSDIGPIKIKLDLQGGSGDESGKIISGGRIASLDVGSFDFSGSIRGGDGNYDTTTESEIPQLGQVFARGAIGPVNVFGNVQGNTGDSEGGAYSAQIRGQSIASVTIHRHQDSEVPFGGNVQGGYGAHSGGFFATGGNIGKVVIEASLLGGGGSQSGFLSAEGNLTSVSIAQSLAGGGGTGSGYVAAGDTLSALTVDFASGGSSLSRPRISAGKTITAVTVNGSIYNTDILAGYTTSGFEYNSGAQIGTVKIGSDSSSTESGAGFMSGTNIIAGISAGTDGIFGNSNDHIISGPNNPGGISKIASIIVKGAITNTYPSTDLFGIIAQNIGTIKVGGSALPLAPGKLNDSYTPTSVSSDTVYGELFSIVRGG